jgi:glycolate oxidase iron-sulfur subunit
VVAGGFNICTELLKAGRFARPFLPRSLKQKIPTQTVTAKPRTAAKHKRHMLMLEGCVQPSLSPNTWMRRKPVSGAHGGRLTPGGLRLRLAR